MSVLGNNSQQRTSTAAQSGMLKAGLSVSVLQWPGLSWSVSLHWSVSSDFVGHFGSHFARLPPATQAAVQERPSPVENWF